SNLALSKYVSEAVQVLKAAHFDLIVLETSGIGQSDTEIVEHSDVSLYVMTPEFGAASQLEKIDMLDFADIVAINKFDKRGGLDALRDVSKQYSRNHGLWGAKDGDLPIFGTIASQFNDPGMDQLYHKVMATLAGRTGAALVPGPAKDFSPAQKIFVIPPSRTRYLSEIAESNRAYDAQAKEQAGVAQTLYGVFLALAANLGLDPAMAQTLFLDRHGLREEKVSEHIKMDGSQELAPLLIKEFDKHRMRLLPGHWETILNWEALKARYRADTYYFKVRDREIGIKTHSESLSHSQIPKVALPKFRGWGDILLWCLQENVPGEFPFTAGLYPFKREGEDPTRMFAGEGGPERTNRRFHYVSLEMPAKRLSTAFDSVTL